MRARPAAIAAAVMLAASAAAAGERADHHVGTYYPEPQRIETYGPRVQTLPQASIDARVGFVVGLSKALRERPYAPAYVIFEKGDDSDKLIIVAVEDGVLDTLYRARAVLADLTQAARLLPAFAQSERRNRLTFFDLAKLLGFKQITVSDGRAFAHQVILK